MTKILPWRVLQREYVRVDEWITLRADDCLTAEGVQVAPYYVLEYPDWVQVVAISPRDQVLLIEQYRHGQNGVSVELPAGRIDEDDRDPLAAAARELREETGGAAEHLELIQQSSPNPASHTNRVQTVLATRVTMRHEPADDPRERILWRWVAPEIALDLALRGALPALHTASLCVAFAHLGWLRFTPPQSVKP